ncbi:hypothetical protein BKG91_08575 [Rodentibacter caecimuris]|uniref:Excinuclease ABC subunit A n=1 Tax=Rodentibacter caecimuris TaxID=1796644 RepID=A0AAJ3MZW2_9PAST|nr:hypothetical protein [Rodentibacter heylii]AOF52519.1 hypothetical protein AC062_0422 [Pasteurellaceae bacterium NI1060]MCX2961058.1 hypothetical protein [Rodentibacter heylii]OOF73521.1 hypothetical protein BKG90_00265 [Rodentibacter heylii]OOF73751.1 hypothetical protein BKG91_08575 [Rodentibacter heylii]OOF76437.1 hypothetical protein BKG99_06190 [Rodentibacter heylii]
MKLMKFAPALAAALVLSACSTASDVVSNTTDAISKTTNAVVGGASQAVTSVKDGVSSTVKTVTDKLDTATKSAVYLCKDNTLVIATYGFEAGKAKNVNIAFGKKAIKDLKVNEKAPNPVTFESKSYRWNADVDFSLETFDKSSSVMLTKLGKQTDQILVKNCKIDELATAKMNNE